MSILQNILIFFIAMSSFICAAQEDAKEERKKYSSLVARSDREIAELKRKHQDGSKEAHDEKYLQSLFDAYMQKAAGYFHLGERDKQLGCYQEILGIKGLAKLTLARTHTNISVVYLHLGRNIVAATHLTKAEELAQIQDIEQTMGAQTYSVFATIYDKTAQDLHQAHPQQALAYQKKALQVPKQDERWYSLGHLKLAVLYDTLLMSSDSLNHALQALNYKLLTPEEHDKALCYASLGSAGLGRTSDCIRYFERIKNLKGLHKNEVFLVLYTLSGCYLRDRKWEVGIKLRHQAIDVLDPSSPEYLFGKYHIATAYGESGNKEKEVELYAEVLEAIRRNTFDQEWQEGMQSIQMLIDAFFFMKEMAGFEQRFREPLEQTSKTIEAERVQERQKSQEEERLKRKQEKEKRKEKAHQQLIEHIKIIQREAVEKERRLDGERKKKIEAERIRAEERKSQLIPTQGIPIIEPKSTQPERHIIEQKTPRVKTRGVGTESEILEEGTQVSPEPILLTLPKLGTCAQTVFNQIECEDWSFTRENYTHYLEDLQCKRRETGSSHRIFQLPKTTIITLERNGQGVREHLYLADVDIKLGSVTLPAWKGKQIPFYLRKQLRSFHERIIMLYRKVNVIGSEILT